MIVTHFEYQFNPATKSILEDIVKRQSEMLVMVEQAVVSGQSLDSVEREIHRQLVELGRRSLDLLLEAQGQGDLGEELKTASGTTLFRSETTVTSHVRSIFGNHEFKQYAYSQGLNKRNELLPISARLSLPDHRWSFYLQEFAQLTSADQSFGQSSATLESFLLGRFSVDTLECICQSCGVDAGAFVEQLPVPDPKEEGPILVATADCKGVPLIKEDANRVASFESAKKRPGNRRMSMVASVYSITPYQRTAKDVVDALFREEPLERIEPRPLPRHKNTTAHMPTIFVDVDEDVAVSAISQGMGWLGPQVESRWQDKQPLIVLMDGQQALWEAADFQFPATDSRVVPILDIIHVSSYLWEAAGLFAKDDSTRKQFVRKRILEVLEGKVKGVIQGLRRMGTARGLTGPSLRDLQRICGYFEKHRDRMKYDEYLAKGYPIATGVIEGACRHLVKDRMERSGMRWTLEGARSMLHIRAILQGSHWRTYCTARIVERNQRTHPHRNLVSTYTPETIAA
jgi:hypothetical protein